MQRFASFESVLSHAGQDYDQSAASKQRRNGVKEYIDGWAAKVLLRTLVGSENSLPIFLSDHHVEVSRRDYRATGSERLPGDAFVYRECRLCRKSRRQQ